MRRIVLLALPLVLGGCGGEGSPEKENAGTEPLPTESLRPPDSLRIYDSLSYPTSETSTVAGGPPRTTTRQYDGVGRVSSMTYPSGRVVLSSYDALDRLDVVSSNGLFVADHDYFGRRRVERMWRPFGLRTTYGFDAARRIASVLSDDGGPVAFAEHSYVYDANYNMTQRVET
jgi:uncharacterized protein RhaS with RHS repeats